MKVVNLRGEDGMLITADLTHIKELAENDHPEGTVTVFFEISVTRLLKMMLEDE